MKKVKQVLAILLILILIGLYVSTLVFAIIGSERAMVWLKISIQPLYFRSCSGHMGLSIR